MEIVEEKIKEARKNILRAGDIAHFGGEFILLGSMLGANLTLVVSEVPSYDLFQLMGKGALGYLLLQPPAFLLKGLSMDREQNYAFAERFEKESKKKGLEGLFDKMLIKMHQHFARNSERYNSLIKTYEWAFT